MDMKKLKVLIMSAIVILTAASALAADQLVAGIALKGYYVTSWSNTYNNGISDVKIEAKNPVLMLGPSVKINYGKFFTGLTYVTAVSDFEAEISGVMIGKADRQDTDFVMGYAPLSWLSFYGGYKRINSSVKPDYGSTAAVSVGGPAAGIAVNYQIPNIPVSIYANAAYMYLDGQAWLQTVYCHGYSFEGGLTFSPISNLSLSIGYKEQVLPWSSDLAGKENIKGITFSVQYMVW
jgi:hypothetical protein